MKFSIEYTNSVEQKELMYYMNDCSFNTEPTLNQSNLDIVINKLYLTSIDEDNKIVEVWGFCPYKGWIKSKIQVPEYNKGILRVLDNLEYGVGSYRVADWPVYRNKKTGWVCLGEPNGKGNAVEFMTNCVAVIGFDGDFVALWLKPQFLP